MNSPPASPSPRRGVRNYFREKYHKFVHSHSRSPSQLESEDPNVSNLSPRPTISPPPNQRSSSRSGNFLAPTSISQLRHSRSDSHVPSSSSPTTRSQEKARGAIWTGLQITLEGLRKAAGIFPPLESAVGSLISVLDLLEAASEDRPEYEAIASELKTMGESLTRHITGSNSARMSDCIANVALGIEQQVKMIGKKRDRGVGSRLMGAMTDGDDVVTHYRKVESLFRQLQTDANLSTWSIANEHLANTRLEGLMPAKMADYDSKLSTEISRRACTEGTRTAVLAEMKEWSLNPDAPDLYLMSGMAGTGKTTIACSFSNQLEEQKQLAASFFCTRTSPECRDASKIIPTIVYQLARYSIPFQSALCEVLGRNPDIGSKNIVKQFERLLKEPLLKTNAMIGAA
ncbi:NACHT domain containing protein [Ceratobasidium theobromae]|uniref:NACHT domain containing protein n=1 Tax=Ceratobasidium theobromae TaxID=1582974 RepID=A0A5N5Q849_9AGAM|nr:NACHT domain containing protein [Ceratobasidium theobromae]